MTARPTVYIETYGCQMNVSDTELMLGSLEASGYRPVDGPDGADVILVNTCAIRDHAEQRVIGRLGELKRHMKAGTVLGVAGCMAQRLGPTLLEKARHVSLVVGPDGYRALPQLLDGARREGLTEDYIPVSLADPAPPRGTRFRARLEDVERGRLLARAASPLVPRPSSLL